MTLQDLLVLLVLVNICLSLLLLMRLRSVRRELVKLRRQRVYRPPAKVRGKGNK